LEWPNLKPGAVTGKEMPLPFVETIRMCRIDATLIGPKAVKSRFRVAQPTDFARKSANYMAQPMTEIAELRPPTTFP
jgi:hypothetical protein